MRHSFKAPRHIHKVTLPSGRVINTDYDIAEDEELGILPVAAVAAAPQAIETGKKIVNTVVDTVGGIFKDKNPKDLCGNEIKGVAGKMVNYAMTHKAEDTARYWEKIIIEGTVKNGGLPPGTTVEDYKSGKVALACPVKGGNITAAPTDNKDNKSELTKKQVRSALTQVLDNLTNKKLQRRNLISDIVGLTRPELNKIKKMVLNSAISRNATSEHNKRRKVNDVIRKNNNKQNQMLRRLANIEKTLQIKKVAGQALAAAFGIPSNYV